ncbi:MAG: nucleotide exchange factor GrpE [Parcubacteria group bacterium]
MPKKEVENESSAAEVKETEEEKMRKERDEYLDGWKRAKAELINYKNDELKRMNEVIRFAGEDIIRDMIGIMDSFDLCLAALGDKDMEMTKGVYMIRAQMEDMLKRRGLERIIVSVDHPFDPAIHEAISVTESDKPSGTVIEEIEKGYMWNGKLLRPARVVVSK